MTPMQNDKTNAVAPHFQTAGAGPYILCLHCSTGSWKQWQVFMERMASDHSVFACDLYGYGKSPAWDNRRALELDDEIALLEPVLKSIPGPFHLVGHSYGAAVAMRIAQLYPTRIRSLAVYEPVLFNLLFQGGELEAAAEIWMVQDDVYRLLADDRRADAARRFVDYWSGDGAWESLSDWQKAAIEQRMEKVRADFDATLGHLTPLAEFGKLQVPTLFLYGLQSPQTTVRIADLLARTLPNVEVRGLLPVGHLAPITHAEQIADILARFIRAQPPGIRPHQISRNCR